MNLDRTNKQNPAPKVGGCLHFAQRECPEPSAVLVAGSTMDRNAARSELLMAVHVPGRADVGGSLRDVGAAVCSLAHF